MTSITFRKGTSKDDRAVFVCAKTTVPTAMISRILNKIIKDGMPESKANRYFIAQMNKKYEKFLEALDKAEISYPQAIQMMAGLVPVKQKAAPRISKEAAAIVKALCRKYAGKTAEEMFDAFSETMGREEFKSLVIGMINAAEKVNGRNKLGKIRVRIENPIPMTPEHKAKLDEGRKTKKVKK